jgi:hypothetical protein
VFITVFTTDQRSNKEQSVKHVACMGERKGEHRALVGKPEGNTTLKT